VTAPLILQHVGVWEGVVSELDRATGATSSRKTRVTMRHEGSRWIQKNEYFNEDGTVTALDIEGTLGEDGSITLDLPRMRAIARPVDDRTMTFLSSRPDGGTGFEIQTLVSPTHRCRTSMGIAGESYSRVTHWEEWKVS
jgi:hypothetical protein